MTMQAHDLEIFADYFQFYVQDADTEESFAEGWTDETVAAMFIAKTSALAVGTARNMRVPVRLEIHAGEPADIGGWDRQNSASITVGSGRLQVIGCTDYEPDAFVASIIPGTYQVRVSYFDLDTLRENDLEGDDRYLVQLWPT